MNYLIAESKKPILMDDDKAKKKALEASLATEAKVRTYRSTFSSLLRD
jgi:hypothetical protein